MWTSEKAKSGEEDQGKQWPYGVIGKQRSIRVTLKMSEWKAKKFSQKSSMTKRRALNSSASHWSLKRNHFSLCSRICLDNNKTEPGSCFCMWCTSHFVSGLTSDLSDSDNLNLKTEKELSIADFSKKEKKRGISSHLLTLRTTWTTHRQSISDFWNDFWLFVLQKCICKKNGSTVKSWKFGF